MTNNNTIEKQERRIARPPKVLIPMIKQDLHEASEACKRAGMPYYVAAGEKLIEAKGQLSHGQWGDWLKKNFHLSQFTARTYMRAATKTNAGARFETLSEVAGDSRTSHTHPWTAPVQDVLKNLRMENLNLRKHDLSEAKENSLERKLALQLIDIGYKVLSMKLHPDKGGSADAMRRLNKVRMLLKAAL